MHIHIGRTKGNLPVKITASRNLTFENIVKEAYHRKGLSMIGVIDAHSPPVQEEIEEGLRSGLFYEHPDGGIVYQGVTCILGAEIEIKEQNRKPAHVLVYLPTLEKMKQLSHWLKPYVKNLQLSTQRLHLSVRYLQEKVIKMGGLFIPAHVFTPFKSIFGSAADHLSEILDPSLVEGIELGLSADSAMADSLKELHTYPYLSNSDAHSLSKIGREYNQMWVKEASFLEFQKVLKRQENRRIMANYGLDPRLGKYYRTRCLSCDALWEDTTLENCSVCGSNKKVKGVLDRIYELSDIRISPNLKRPPYIYQVPLEFIPKLGKKTLDRLLNHFGTEMNILHHVSVSDIAKVAGESIAQSIEWARKGKLLVEEGGGGIYGRVKIPDSYSYKKK